MVISALTIEGADAARRDAAGAGAAGWLSLLLLENMVPRLDEIIRVLHAIVVPDFVMDMGPGAAPCRTHPSHPGAFADLRSHPHAHRGKMGIARVDAIAVIDFHHIAVTAAIAREHDQARRGRVHDAAPGTGEIDAGMKGVAAGEGIDPGPEAAG